MNIDAESINVDQLDAAVVNVIRAAPTTDRVPLRDTCIRSRRFQQAAVTIVASMGAASDVLGLEDVEQILFAMVSTAMMEGIRIGIDLASSPREFV